MYLPRACMLIIVTCSKTCAWYAQWVDARSISMCCGYCDLLEEMCMASAADRCTQCVHVLLFCCVFRSSCVAHRIGTCTSHVHILWLLWSARGNSYGMRNWSMYFVVSLFVVVIICVRAFAWHVTSVHVLSMFVFCGYGDLLEDSWMACIIYRCT
jgi:hypothetical protein